MRGLLAPFFYKLAEIPLTSLPLFLKLPLTESFKNRACSSVGERCPYKADVAGSIPATPTKYKRSHL
jgi:hypothetical protein